MRRRRFITAAGAGTVVALAGCTDSDGGDGDGDDSGTENGTDDGAQTEPEETPELTVATYGSFLDAPSTSPGEWLQTEFESAFDAELTYQSPDGEVGHYIQRRQQGADIDADLYLGVNTDELVNADEQLEENLFEPNLDVAGQEHIREGLAFDPENRAIPFNTGYISLVYNGTETEAPETFEGLLDEEHRGDLIAQDPGQSTTGQAFLYHTIHHFGEDDYLDFWADLQDNDVRVLGSWGDAYGAWSEGEAPMVVSFSTDQVFAAAEGADLEEHQIRFLNDQAYANPEGAAIFSESSNAGLAREFIEFLLEPEIQGGIAQRNVTFPATDNADLPDDYAELAQEPPEPVTFTYEELQGSHSEWVEAWERQFAGN